MESSPSPPPATPPAAPLPSSPSGRNWWQRNWKWFVPTGCLSLIALGLAFVVCIILVVFGALKSTDTYKTAVSRAKADPRVQQALGTPIETGWLVSGSTNATVGSGSSELTIPIEGPRGKANIYVVATKSAGDWEYSKMVVKVAGSNETIDLNQAAKE
jgi:hypothetical protein